MTHSLALAAALVPPRPRPPLPSASSSSSLLDCRLDWTDVFYRQLARLLSRHTWLYTEMVVDQTLLHNPQHDKFLWCAAGMPWPLLPAVGRV